MVLMIVDCLANRNRVPGWMRARILAGFFLIAIAAVLSGTAHAGEQNPLTLPECIEIALKQSPLIKSAELDLAASEETVKASKGALFPKIDINASHYEEWSRPVPYIQAEGRTIGVIASQYIYAWGLFLRMPVYEGGRLMGLVKISELDMAIQASRKQFTIQDLAGNVTNTFNKILQLRALRTAYMKSVEALDQQTKNTELLVKSGRSAKVDLLRIEVQLASEQQNLIRTGENIKRAQFALAYFMGVKADEVTEIQGRLTADEKQRDTNIDELINQRPDIVAYTRKMEQAKEKVDVAKGKRYPSIALVGTYGQKSGADVTDAKMVTEGGIVASINVFDAGIISAEIARERALFHKAEEELRQAKLKARLEVDTALSSLKESESKVMVSEKAVAQAAESLRIEELKYKTGAGTITDYLLAASAESLAQANYYQALFDYNAASTEFKRSTGTIEVEP
jgi:outer membrane protein